MLKTFMLDTSKYDIPTFLSEKTADGWEVVAYHDEINGYVMISLQKPEHPTSDEPSQNS